MIEALSIRQSDFDWSGRHFGSLLALRKSAERQNKRVMWDCECVCGKHTTVMLYSLTSGKTTSCGCVQRNAVTKHGHAKGNGTPEYRVWHAMLNRCLNPKNESFRHYGSRGITVCDSWKVDFQAFLNDMGPRPSSVHSIERLDNDGNYEPANCCWALNEEQANNKRINRHVIVKEQTMTVAQAARHFGLGYQTYLRRLNRGLSAVEAGETPLHRVLYDAREPR